MKRLTATLALLPAVVPAMGADKSVSCESLAVAKLFPNTTVSSVQVMAADAGKGMPARAHTHMNVCPFERI